jgi:hypothetical protein
MKCPNCGADASGKFCASCGASLRAASCTVCGKPLSPGAKFCHACGTPVHGAADSPAGRGPVNPIPWVIAAAAVVVALLVLGVAQLRTASAGAPAAQAPAAGAMGAPVDLSQMTPRDAADRLFNRIMTAYENGAKDTAQFFAPMALQAYGMVDSLDADARYHVGLIDLVTADYPGTLAQADTIARSVPGHLYASVLRAEVARARGDSAALRRAQAAFLEHYDAESRANRPEYAQHPGVLDRFRAEALQAQGRAP